jgi:peptide/nickel transport system permease protein
MFSLILELGWEGKVNKANQKASKGFYRISWGLLKKNKLAMVCLVVVILLIGVAVFAPLISPYDPNMQEIKNKLKGPSLQHFLGTDEYGRDIFSRIIFGCRISLSVGVISQLIATVIGFGMGACAGYFGKKTDAIISFIIQVFSSFPFLLIAIAIMFVLGPGLNNLYIALGLLSWTPTSRLVRGDVLKLKNSEYIQACIIGSGSHFRIIMKHLLPNCIYTLIITATLGIPSAILSEASLSFLGLGVQPPMASWGSMISSAQSYIRSATYYSIAPGIAIIITVMAFNLLGDGLRDALDPKMRS